MKLKEGRDKRQVGRPIKLEGETELFMHQPLGTSISCRTWAMDNSKKEEERKRGASGFCERVLCVLMTRLKGPA